MSKHAKFFDNFSRSIRLGIHTSAPARVIKYDAANKEADIELLFMTVYKDGSTEQYPLIEGAPVLKHVGALAKDDIVFVAFSERALDNLQKKPFDPDASRMHDVRDAVILGVIEL
ncbi:Gp138 family membrane-puncturing spike protein [Exiguobacterium sp. R-39]|uniref:Gp138 family membrane-puncturing spike protein n=1 Tax=Exiguobacterium sp. R-39 TaxID=3416708 RepID=UPI003CFB230C